jgi:hypothetical protein
MILHSSNSQQPDGCGAEPIRDRAAAARPLACRRIRGAAILLTLRQVPDWGLYLFLVLVPGLSQVLVPARCADFRRPLAPVLLQSAVPRRVVGHYVVR